MPTSNKLLRGRTRVAHFRFQSLQSGKPRASPIYDTERNTSTIQRHALLQLRCDVGDQLESLENEFRYCGAVQRGGSKCVDAFESCPPPSGIQRSSATTTMTARKVCAQQDQRHKPPLALMPPYMFPTMKPQFISSIIVEAVASVFHSCIGHALDEVARRDLRGGPFQRNIHRKTLRSMCLVSKSWAEECQRIFRRRMVITSVPGMKSFLQNSQHGSYVLELVYVHDTGGVQPEDENPPRSKSLAPAR